VATFGLTLGYHVASFQDAKPAVFLGKTDGLLYDECFKANFITYYLLTITH